MIKKEIKYLQLGEENNLERVKECSISQLGDKITKSDLEAPESNWLTRSKYHLYKPVKM